MKNKRMQSLNQLSLALQQTGAWMIHDDAAHGLHAAMLDCWKSRDVADESFAAVPGFRVVSAGKSDANAPQIIGGIGVVSLSGMVRAKEDIWTHYGYGTANSTLAGQVELLLNRSDVSGVLLVVDSPGGMAVGNEEATRKMRAAAESSGKPLWAVVDGYCASAAYYLASAADNITVAPGAVVGSIGAVLLHAHWRPEDVTFTVTKFGDMKWTPNGYEAIGDAGQAENQRIVDQLGSQFLATVADMRGVSLADAKAKFGNGQVFYDAAEMIQRGLVDAKADSVNAVLQKMQSRFSAPSTVPGMVSQSQLEASCQTNHESGQRATTSATHKELTAMEPKLKAALYARGLIASVDASNDVAEAALVAFFAGRGIDRPKTDADALAAFNGTGVKSVETAKPAANVQEAHDRELAEARAAARADEVTRAKSIRGRGALLKIDSETIEAGVASGKTADEVIASFVDKMASDQPPVVAVSNSGEQAFAKDAGDAMAIRCGLKVDKPSASAVKWANSGITPYAIACQSLEAQGVRFDRWANPEEIGKLALVTGAPRNEALMDDSSGSMNRPSSFPNLLSALSSKLFDEGMQRANPTYPEWTAKSRMDLPDLKEGPMINRSQPYVMDELIDDEKIKQFTLAEECLSLIRVRRFGNKFGWTPVMVANDDLGAFAEGMIGFGAAWENTINLLCLGFLTGNGALLDGTALFDTSVHVNDITSGVVISAANWTAMQNKVVAQRPVGGKGYVRGTLGLVLIPPQIKEAALQTFAAFGSIPEVKNPVTDATVNIYRGSAKVVVEPELQANSTTKWYGMIDPALMPAVVRVYQRGWSSGLRRSAWTDPETGTAWVGFEGRVGAAVKDYRPIVRNAGA